MYSRLLTCHPAQIDQTYQYTICLLAIYVFQPILELGNVKGWAGRGGEGGDE